MSVYRILRAPSALHVASFTSYNEALAYSRAHGLQSKPLRRVEGGQLVWHVPTVSESLSSRPAYVKLPDWRPSIFYFV